MTFNNEEHTAVKVILRPNGPASIIGPITIEDEDGNQRQAKAVSICRCQLSANMPYCDGSHKGQM